MKKFSRILCLATATIWLAACHTAPPPSLTPVPGISIATSRYSEVFNLDRPVITQFGPGEAIAISVHIPRGGGFGVREGTLIVRSTANGRVIRRETQTMKEEDYFGFRQENPGPGKYNIEFSSDNGVLATTWFEVR